MNSQEEKSPKAVRNGRNIDAVIAFLGVEVIGLTLFGFGGAFGLKLLQLFAVFLAFLAYPFLAKCIDKETMKSSLKWLIPLAFFGILLRLLRRNVRALQFHLLFIAAIFGDPWLLCAGSLPPLHRPAQTGIHHLWLARGSCFICPHHHDLFACSLWVLLCRPLCRPSLLLGRRFIPRGFGRQGPRRL